MKHLKILIFIFISSYTVGQNYKIIEYSISNVLAFRWYDYKIDLEKNEIIFEYENGLNETTKDTIILSERRKLKISEIINTINFKPIPQKTNSGMDGVWRTFTLTENDNTIIKYSAWSSYTSEEFKDIEKIISKILKKELRRKCKRPKKWHLKKTWLKNFFRRVYFNYFYFIF